MRFRRARTVHVYWDDGRMLFENFLTRVAVSGDPVTIQVLHVCDRWRTFQELLEELSKYSSASVRKAVHSLLRYTLLVKEGTLAAERDAYLAQVWSHWLPQGAFHFATKDVKYADRERSRRVARRRLAESPQPSFFKRYRRASITRLARLPATGEFLRVLFERRTNREFSSAKVPLNAVSQLLYYTWGVISYYETAFGRLAHKTSPSGGARHPGEVYLLAMNVSGLSPGLYHYDPRKHCLELLRNGRMRDRAVAYCSGQTFVKGASALFLMTAVFSRSMWKYRFPRAYRVVTLDAGHLCQTFCLIATWLGLAPFCTAALQDTLIEQDLGLDGISESVLYAAGVGCLRKRSR